MSIFSLSKFCAQKVTLTCKNYRQSNMQLHFFLLLFSRILSAPHVSLKAFDINSKLCMIAKCH